MSKQSLDFIRIRIKPAEGKRVLDPITGRPLPQEGKEVASNTYWQRRIRDGDVVHVKKTKTKAKKEA